jgi:ubiquinone/menaquinone biosynthesis C-methylase UbiE
MKNNLPSLIYSGKAEFYDFLYSSKNYKEEAKTLNQIIEEYKISNGKKLLDVGCGTAKHIKHLENKYHCEGMDTSIELISIAKQRNRSGIFHVGDMTRFNLDKKFDVIICLFGSIGYLKSFNQFIKVLSNFYDHLNPGGVVIIEPWFSKEDDGFKVDVPFMTTYEDTHLKISRISIAKVKGNFSFMNTHYLVGNGSIQHFNENEKLILISHLRFIKTMEKTGFKSTFLKKGLSLDDRGLYVGVK